MSDTHGRRYLVRRPRALQYFHKGELHRELEEERVAGRFELFFDLLYVAIIANFADDLAEEPTWANFLKFILVFTPAWHAWADQKENANNYYNDDILQRLGVLWIMAILVVYGNNANLIAEDSSALRATVVSYMVLRFSQICFYAVYSIASHHHRTQNRAYFLLIGLGLWIWVPLLFDSISISNKIIIAFIGILYEEASYVLTFGPWVARWLNLDYTTAVDIDHENDRYTAFTILVLGEFTYAILVGSPAKGGLNMNVFRAVCTLVIAFCFNSMYVYCDGAMKSVHPIRRAVWSSFTWLLIHLPLSAGLLVGGHVSAGTARDKHLTEGQRQLWGCGLGIGSFCLFLIALLYRDEDETGLLRFSKKLRLLPRLLMSFVFICLPQFSEDQIDSTHLVSIGAVMALSVVAWEVFGSLEAGTDLFESWSAKEEDIEQNERASILHTEAEQPRYETFGDHN